MDVPVSSRSPLGAFPGNHCEFTRKRTDLHVFCQQAHAACGPRCSQASGQSSQRVPGRPTPRATVLGAWEQEGHLCPPSLAREDLPKGNTEGTGASCSIEGAFSLSRGKTLLRGCILLSSTSFYCFFKQNTFFEVKK